MLPRTPRSRYRLVSRAVVMVLFAVIPTSRAAEEPVLKDGLAGVNRLPEKFAGASIEGGKATLHQGEGWAYLLSKNSYEHVAARLQFTIQQPAKDFRAGGHGDWNAYRFHAYDDGGYEVGVLLRANGAD